MKRKRQEQMHESGCQVESGQASSVYDEDASNFPDGEGIEGAFEADSQQEGVDQPINNGEPRFSKEDNDDPLKAIESTSIRKTGRPDAVQKRCPYH